MPNVRLRGILIRFPSATKLASIRFAVAADTPHNSDIGIHNVVMSFRYSEFYASAVTFVNLPIAHFIIRVDGIDEWCFDREHEFNEYRGFSAPLEGVDISHTTLLAVMDDRLHRQPCESRIPFGKQQCMPGGPHGRSHRQRDESPVQTHSGKHNCESACVPYCFFAQSSSSITRLGNILGQCPKMQDMPFTIYHTHGPCTKHTGFFYQTPRHNIVGSQQTVHRIGIKVYAVAHRSHRRFLLAISLGGARTCFPLSTAVTCSKESVFCPIARDPWMVRIRLLRRRVGLMESEKVADIFPTSSAISRHLVNHLICDFERRLLFHIAPPLYQ